MTCGAGGTTRDLTLAVVRRLARERGLEAVPHVTAHRLHPRRPGRAAGRGAAGGADNVLALRGDPPRGEATWTAPAGGLQSSLELTALAAEAGFCVLGAAYPEPHPDSRGWAADLEHLRAKVDAGVRVLVTQLFFDNDDYRRFVERLRAAGIDVPVLPGIIPITSIGQIERMAALCGARIPTALRRELEARQDDPRAVAELGVAYATAQAAELLADGAAGVHLYTLNRSPATRAIVSALRAQGRWTSGGCPALTSRSPSRSSRRQERRCARRVGRADDRRRPRPPRPTSHDPAADHAAEAAMVAILGAERPEDGIVGEEGASADSAAGGRTWVLDALDGTLNFATGLGPYCCAAALVRDGRALAVAVLEPVGGRLWTAAAGDGAFADGESIRAHGPERLADAILATYAHPDRKGRPGVLDGFRDLVEQAGMLRIIGSGTLDLAWVAEGRLHGWVQPGVEPWDWYPGRCWSGRGRRGGGAGRARGHAVAPRRGQPGAAGRARRRPGGLAGRWSDPREAPRREVVGPDQVERERRAEAGRERVHGLDHGAPRRRRRSPRATWPAGGRARAPAPACR